MYKLFSIHNEMPIRVSRFKLDPVKAEEFNDGDKFIRSDYKYLYRLQIDKGEDKTYIELATPSFAQVLYSIRVLWNSYDGKPYDRHGHPVVLQAHDITPVKMEATEKDAKTRKKVVDAFRKTYSKSKG